MSPATSAMSCRDMCLKMGTCWSLSTSLCCSCAFKRFTADLTVDTFRKKSTLCIQDFIQPCKQEATGNARHDGDPSDLGADVLLQMNDVPEKLNT
mmetsp:Transcript_37233/g.97529  ORF Transcript_37233/g.97529 Transcript_37233/m.97529 type:complete len:95 (-) Transcript_37233:234-518(-)